MTDQPFFNKSRYLKGRPFLVINTIERPRDGVNTNVAGWRSDPENIAILESPTIVDRINDKQMRATCVIDILNTKLIKATIPGRSDEEVLGYYLGKYRELVTKALGIWAEREALTASDVEEVVEAIAAE